ncbi:hypothetical protein [Bradyrhizobium sp. BR 10289]|uniref:hypothetical protein n=1 Tax=Bradyrhizobium sp. BR 10289 TaxID=2749993 RepID=UPI001C65489B|nr:hypothetical protein [Bradyrhizobium sp. BR 10289]MBW7968820.1 hypothetical protein [Bradyrhizobium sp. BR 10289]
MMDQLELAGLHRIGSGDPQKRERYSFDFVVNGISLFEATQALEYDLCGCLSDPQFEPEVARRMNRTTIAQLTSGAPVRGHRVALFVCPECGDLACGAITARVSHEEARVQWSDFAYENGHDAASKLALGPFAFEWAAYTGVIERSRTD